jgi:hypothetical protein
MNRTAHMLVTDEELNAVFNPPALAGITCPAASIEGPRVARSAWVAQVAAGAGAALADDELCESATEIAPAGTLATINALLEGLARRHADDPATLAAVLAVQHFHLPNLLDGCA